MLAKMKKNPDAVIAVALAIVLPIIFVGNAEMWVAVSIGIFVLAFGRKIFGAIAGKLDERSASIETEIAEAHRLREEAKKLLASYEMQRKEAEAEAEQIIAHAKIEAERQAERAGEALEATLKRRSEMAVQRIHLAEEEALAEVRRVAATLAVQAAGRIIRNNMDDAQTDKLIQQSIDEARAKLH